MQLPLAKTGLSGQAAVLVAETVEVKKIENLLAIYDFTLYSFPSNFTPHQIEPLLLFLASPQ
jgi:hypothetical protein